MTTGKIKLTQPQIDFLVKARASRFGEYSVPDYKPLVTLLKHEFVHKNIEARFGGGHYRATEAGEKWLKENGL